MKTNWPIQENSPADLRDTGAMFHTTRWTMVAMLGAASPRDSEKAANLLCQSAWAPLYAYARRKGCPAQDAEDVVQQFLAAFLQSGRLARADRSRGKLRTYLLSSFLNFLTDYWRSRHTLQRGRGHDVISLSSQGEDGPMTDVPGEAPEVEFNRNWAREILQQALDLLEAKYKELGQSERLEALLPYLPWFSGEASYAGGAEKLGISPMAFKSALFRMRAHYRDLLMRTVAATLGSDNPADIESEIQELQAALVS